jgi:hypothetical protein
MYSRGFMLVFVCFFVSETLLGQTKTDVWRDKIDTISIKNDSLLAKRTKYKNDTIVEEYDAFIFYLEPNSAEPRDFKLIRHGKSIWYFADGCTIITEFVYGKEISTFQFDKNKNISLHANHRIREHSCAADTGREEWIIHGRKKP